jgi:hypothetical protein
LASVVSQNYIIYSSLLFEKKLTERLFWWIFHQIERGIKIQEWREIICLFLMEQSSISIAEKIGLERRRVLRALTKVRMGLAMDVTEIFSGTVEVDETYLGGQ